MIAPALSLFALLGDGRLRLVIFAALMAVILLGLLLAFGPDVDAGARSRTIHPCLLGDEPCTTPAPTPSPR